MMAEVSEYAEEAYSRAGLGPGPGPREVPDHVVSELEFLYYLCFEEVRTEEPIWRQEQTQFWRDHLGVWLPLFTSTISEAEVHPFYTALADLLLAFVEREEVLLGPSRRLG